MANKRLNAVITIGGTVTGALKSALGTTRSKLQQIGGTIRDLEREQRKLGASTREAMNAGRPVGQLAEQYQALAGQIGKARREQERLTKAQGRMNAGKEMMGRGGVLLGAAVGAATLGAVPVIQAAQDEKAFLGIAKQLDGARDAAGKLTPVYAGMVKQIYELGREIPIPTRELAGMAEQLLRQGVPANELIGQLRNVSMMATALGLDTEQTAERMGKLGGLFHLTTAGTLKLGDAINYLDDKTRASGEGMLDFLYRTGGIAGSVKVTAEQMAALGATFEALGTPAENAGTATNAFFQKLAAAEKGTKKFRGAMQSLGLSLKDVQRGMQNDATGTMLKVLDAVNRLPKDQRLGTLVDMVGLEHSDEIAKLVTGIDQQRENLVLAGKGAGSVRKEFSAAAATSDAQWQLLGNTMREVSVVIGATLLPAVNSVMKRIADVGAVVADWARANPGLTKGIIVVGGAITALVGGLGALGVAVGAASFAIGGLGVALAALTGPVGWTIGAVTLLGAGAAALIANWKPVGKFFSDLWDGIVGKTRQALDWIVSKVEAVGSVVRSLGAAIGFGGSPAATRAPASGPRLPNAPMMATARGAGGGTYAPNYTQTFNLTQAPGQDSKTFARDVVAAMRADEQRRRGSILYDAARGY